MVQVTNRSRRSADRREREERAERGFRIRDILELHLIEHEKPRGGLILHARSNRKPVQTASHQKRIYQQTRRVMRLASVVVDLSCQV